MVAAFSANGCGGLLSSTSAASEDAAVTGNDANTYLDALTEVADAAAIDGMTAPDVANESPLDSGALLSDLQCGDASTIVYVKGDPDSYIFTGTSATTDPQGTTVGSYHAPDDLVRTQTPAWNDAGGLDPSWILAFYTGTMKQSIQANTLYEPAAAYYDTNQPPMPHILVQYGSKVCAKAQGGFLFTDLAIDDDAGKMEHFAVQFWIRCDGYSGYVRGCVHDNVP